MTAGVLAWATANTLPVAPLADETAYVAQLHICNRDVDYTEHQRDEYIVFCFQKPGLEELMTPGAHFYGPKTYGLLMLNAYDILRVKDIPGKGITGKLTAARVLLTSATGVPFPMVPAPELYPSMEEKLVRVDLATWQHAHINARLWLVPDESRMPGTWRAIAPPASRDDLIPIRSSGQEKVRVVHVLSKQAVSGKEKYLRVYNLQRKVYGSPTTWFAGACVPLSGPKGLIAKRQIQSNTRAVKVSGPDLFLAVGEDMCVDNHELRISSKFAPHSYYAYRLEAQNFPSHANLRATCADRSCSGAGNGA